MVADRYERVCVPPAARSRASGGRSVAAGRTALFQLLTWIFVHLMIVGPMSAPPGVLRWERGPLQRRDRRAASQETFRPGPRDSHIHPDGALPPNFPRSPQTLAGAGRF